MTSGEAVRLCLLSAGIWWALFTVRPLVAPRGWGKTDVVASQHLLVR